MRTARTAALKGPHVSSCLYTTRITGAISLKHVLNMQFNMRTVCVSVCVRVYAGEQKICNIRSFVRSFGVRSVGGQQHKGVKGNNICIADEGKTLEAVLFLCAS